jgi:hypothetical protein
MRTVFWDVATFLKINDAASQKQSSSRKNHHHHQVFRKEVPKLWDLTGGAVGCLRGRRVVCMRGIFILNEIWAIYFGRHSA